MCFLAIFVVEMTSLISYQTYDYDCHLWTWVEILVICVVGWTKSNLLLSTVFSCWWSKIVPRGMREVFSTANKFLKGVVILSPPFYDICYDIWKFNDFQCLIILHDPFLQGPISIETIICSAFSPLFMGSFNSSPDLGDFPMATS